MSNRSEIPLKEKSQVLDLNRILMVSRAHNMCKSGLDPIDCKSSSNYKLSRVLLGDSKKEILSNWTWNWIFILKIRFSHSLKTEERRDSGLTLTSRPLDNSPIILFTAMLYISVQPDGGTSLYNFIMTIAFPWGPKAIKIYNSWQLTQTRNVTIVYCHLNKKKFMLRQRN